MQNLADLPFDESVPLEVRRRLSQARLVYDYDTVARAVDQLAVRMTVAMQDANPVLICLLHGGLVFMGMLMQRLVFPLQQGYIHVGRYGDNTSGGELTWHARHHPELAGRRVVIVDDILDKGETLARVIEALQALQPASIETVVLVDKELEDAAAAKPVQADFVGIRSEDAFLVGCGMDYQGYGRNLAGIYAID